MPGPRRRIDYIALDEITPARVNPKGHADEEIDASFDRFGYTEPSLLDERTGRLVAGHGRLDRLKARHARGEPPPDGIIVAKDGRWKIPVVRGWASVDDAEADAYLIASNRLTEAGGWNDPEALAAMLRTTQATDLGLAGIGYTPTDLDDLLAQLAVDLNPGDGDDEGRYTRKLNAPQYEPTSEHPPPIVDLYDTEWRDELRRRIDAADLPDEVAGFLREAANRHTRFRYDRIAEFYAHADAATQQLMEESALVIIDLDDAIRLGYVRLSERLDELLTTALSETDE